VSAAFEPSAEEARRLLREELSDRVYREAEPNWFDRLVSGFLEWLGSLAVGDGAAPAALLGLLLVLVVGAAIAAILIFGLPRLRRRRPPLVPLFGEDDDRSAAELRAAAARAAARGDFTAAVLDGFRALARGLDERGLLLVSPGTTAHAVAEGAVTVLPEARAELERAAGDFDRARYQGLGGDEAAWYRVRDLDERMRAARTPAGSPA